MTPEEVRAVRLAEYAALRGEITAFLSLQGQFMNYSIALGGGILAFWAKDATALQAPGLLAFLVSPFLILGTLYGDVEIRILRAAHYIETELRGTLVDGSSSCLEWESYIRKQGRLTKFLSGVNWFRYWVFLMPALAFSVLLWLSRSNIRHPYWCGVFVAIDFILLLLFVGVIAALKYYERAIRQKTV